MKIHVLCSREDRRFAADVLSLLRTLRLGAAGYAVGEAWRSSDRRLDEVLAPATHLVAVLTERSSRASWLPFVAGLAAGSDRPLVLFRPSGAAEPDAYLSPFFLLSSIGELSAFLETEASEWQELSGRREARRELLELGISFRGEALAELAAEGNARGVVLFLKAGFSPDARDRRGVPLLCLAARNGNRAMAESLLSRGASLDAQSDDRGNTALMDAVAGGHGALAEFLIAEGAAPNPASKDGQTALTIAVGKNDSRLASLLLHAGADPDLPDKLGLSPRKYAALFHDAGMAALFSRFPGPAADPDR